MEDVLKKHIRNHSDRIINKILSKAISSNDLDTVSLVYHTMNTEQAKFDLDCDSHIKEALHCADSKILDLVLRWKYQGGVNLGNFPRDIVRSADYLEALTKDGGQRTEIVTYLEALSKKIPFLFKFCFFYREQGTYDLKLKDAQEFVLFRQTEALKSNLLLEASLKKRELLEDTEIAKFFALRAPRPAEIKIDEPRALEPPRRRTVPTRRKN